MFLDRLVYLRKVPRSGPNLHAFVDKVVAGLDKQDHGFLHYAMVQFGEVRCRQGMMAVWPILKVHVNDLPAGYLVDAIWAGSSIPQPPREVVRELEEAATALGPRLREIPDEDLPNKMYRCVYGLARASGGSRCEDFRRRSERVFSTMLSSRGVSPWQPSQLVRLCWSLGRLGCRHFEMYKMFEPLLWKAIPDLSDRELEALYRMLTDLQLTDQWKLIHDVERAMQVREETRSGDRDQAFRRRPFRNKWTRPNPLTHSATRGPGARKK